MATPVMLRLSVRRATAADCSDIVALNCALARETEAGLELDPERVAAGVGACLRSSATPLSPRFWVAIEEETASVIGCIGVSPEWSDWWNCCYWWIMSVFVDARFRRRGVASLLLEQLLADSAIEDVQTVNLRVERCNVGAQAFYAARGFAVDDSHVVMSRGRRPDGGAVGAQATRTLSCPPRVVAQYHHGGFSDASFAAAVAWTPRPSDVVIATAPKSGTTLLQWTCHLIRVGVSEGAAALKARTRGFAFDDIYQMAVWLQMAHDLGIDINADAADGGYEQHCGDVAAPLYPRLFKSHQRLRATDPRCKRIVTLRAPAAVARSWWRFLRSHDVPPLRKYSCVSDFLHDSDFFADGMRFGATLEEYYIEYANALEDRSVLVLCFEDLVAPGGVAAHVPLLARFMELNVDGDDEKVEEEARCDLAEVAEVIGELTSKRVMLEPGLASKFDESWAYARLTEVGRNPDPSAFTPVQRVVLGSSSDAPTDTPNELDESAHSFLKERWAGTVAKQTGAADYPELVERCRSALRARFPRIHPYQH